MARRLLTFPNTPPATQYVQGLTEGLPYLERDRQRRLQQQNRQEDLGLQLAQMDDQKKNKLVEAIDELAMKATPEARAALLKGLSVKSPELFSRSRFANILESQWATAIPEKVEAGIPWDIRHPEFPSASETTGARIAKAEGLIKGPQPREKFDWQKTQAAERKSQADQRIALSQENTYQREASEAADRMNSRSDMSYSQAIWENLSLRAQEILGGAPFTKPPPPETINNEITLTNTIDRLEQNKANMIRWAGADTKEPDPTRLHRYDTDIKRYEAQLTAVRSRTPVTGEDAPTTDKLEGMSAKEKMIDVWRDKLPPDIRKKLQRGVDGGVITWEEAFDSR